MRTALRPLLTALIALACGEMSLDPNPVRLDGDPTEAPDAASSPESEPEAAPEPNQSPCAFERRWFSPDVEYVSLRGFFGFDAEGAQVELHGTDVWLVARLDAGTGAAQALEGQRRILATSRAASTRLEVELSPDGERHLLWAQRDPDKQQVLAPETSEGVFVGGAVSADGHRAVALHCAWDDVPRLDMIILEDGELLEVRRLDDTCEAGWGAGSLPVTFDHTGARVFVAGREKLLAVGLRDETSTVLHVRPGEGVDESWSLNAVPDLDLHPTADDLAFTTAEGELRFIDGAGRPVGAPPRPVVVAVANAVAYAPPFGVSPVRFDPTGRLLVVSGGESTLEVLDASTGEALSRLSVADALDGLEDLDMLPGNAPLAVAFSLDGRLAGSFEGGVALWGCADEPAAP
jgi:hypothetical protein